jgi:hypothetical protein
MPCKVTAHETSLTKLLHLTGYVVPESGAFLDNVWHCISPVGLWSWTHGEQILSAFYLCPVSIYELFDSDPKSQDQATMCVCAPFFLRTRRETNTWCCCVQKNAESLKYTFKNPQTRLHVFESWHISTQNSYPDSTKSTNAQDDLFWFSMYQNLVYSSFAKFTPSTIPHIVLKWLSLWTKICALCFLSTKSTITTTLLLLLCIIPAILHLRSSLIRRMVPESILLPKWLNRNAW